MVSSPHEAMHRIFQEYPGLFSRVSEVLGVDIPPPSSATALPTDLTETRPLERRVDTLLRIDTEHDGPFLLAIEAQGKKDPAKTASWPYYVAYLNNRYRLPILLLVVCQDRATAEWAARPISIGLRQWQTLALNPLVAGPHNMPVITDVAEARKDLALATLAAITHADNPDVGAILKTLSAALRDTPETIADPIVELIAQGLGNRPAAQQWRNLVAVDLSFYKSPLSEEIRDEGRAEGRAEGLLLILDVRGIAITDETREKINGCDDPQLLHQWLNRATTAASAEELFAEE
ncbi:hypothetical protein OG369_13295 [Streptomyces sp. NBC_01221]|uniref:hypothetical protein n=1 Tax=unclassified Streptomyces TaxID=2593676 RepID=UPI0022550EAC|nr:MULTISPECIES: hypothetical protein [unclassified Streptomyces]MCX4787125.1 hypothetical protein [Streptomyces sp. NBC_01221]MCX4797092.1 hypothetical protein [Streptomyces sp. NBC_01242]WSJ38392.1 hypothetical protein OG772_21865 [Streptomyces sp. NBC_01321]WSP55443.1 hypothetical protein OG306_14355 [Streptomyces sp. NBC_01241]